MIEIWIGELNSHMLYHQLCGLYIRLIPCIMKVKVSSPVTLSVAEPTLHANRVLIFSNSTQ